MAAAVFTLRSMHAMEVVNKPARSNDRFRVQAIRSNQAFLTLALVILLVVWSSTLYLIAGQRAEAHHAATLLGRELMATYEAQAVRAVREIDQTLKLVKYVSERQGYAASLEELKSKSLLPPNLLFLITIADRHGEVLQSSRPSGLTNVATQAFFKALHQQDTLWISSPQKSTPFAAAMLHFSRRLNANDGSFVGVVTLSVEAAYFVSGYEESKFGKQGVLGMLGTDGIFRALRSGDHLSAGTVVDYASMVSDSDPEPRESLISVNPWDGVRRYTSARKLFDFPLAVLVGLSQDEQLARYHQKANTYLWIAFSGSALLMLFIMALAYLSGKLEKSQRRTIAAQRRTELQLRIAAAAFDSHEAMLITDANRVILQVNRAFTENTGYNADEIVGQTPSLLKSGRHDDDFYRAMWATINSVGVWQGEIWNRHKNGLIFPIWTTISAVKNAHGAVTHYVGSHFDISDRKQAEEKINELAYFDQLTGLPNRVLLIERLKQCMADPHERSHAALLFIDLDNFKKINDTLGHDMGDMLLKNVAQRLTECVRVGDTVGRLGGDEFVVLLLGLDVERQSAVNQAEMVGRKILATLKQIYQLQGMAYRSTSSIGATVFAGQQASTEDLMRQSDLAMYRAKAAGRDTFLLFDPAMESVARENAALEEDLRVAIGAQQFVLHYQAQVVDEGRLTGAEVLVRWQHPRRGMVPPFEFIPLAEDTGLILPLGQWVLETACQQLAAWSAQPGMSHLTLSVNVSARQFHHANFVDQVLSALARSGARAQRLKLELTESLLVANLDQVVEKMNALKARGVGFSLDDFGTGYSSLSYLKRLPLEQLKIDQSFVRDVDTDADDAAIATTIIALAKALNLGVIAEGVETKAQQDFLAGAGCHAYQGYYFSRPLALAEFEAFARKNDA